MDYFDLKLTPRPRHSPPPQSPSPHLNVSNTNAPNVNSIFENKNGISSSNMPLLGGNMNSVDGFTANGNLFGFMNGRNKILIWTFAVIILFFLFIWFKNLYGDINKRKKKQA